MSGPDLLLKAALTAFVPKETAADITRTIEGMLKDGTLAGIGTLVQDIQEIKRSQARIEFGLARLFAIVQCGEPISIIGDDNLVSGTLRRGLGEPLASGSRPLAISGPGSGSGTGGEPDDVRSGDVGTLEIYGSHTGKDAAE